MALFAKGTDIKFEDNEPDSVTPGDILTKKTLVCAISLTVKLLDKLTGTELSSVGLNNDDKVQLAAAAINSELK